MSAYICDRHHIIYLSKFAAENCKHLRYRVGINDSDPEKLTLHFANLLIRENFRSIYVRYPDTNPEKAEAWKGEETSPLPGDSLCAEPFTLSEIKKSYWLRYNPSQIVKAAQCYSYQACETGNYHSTPAYLLIAGIIEEAAQLIDKQAYEEADWGAPKPEPYCSPNGTHLFTEGF